MPCPSTSPKWFWNIRIILIEYQSFWTGPIYFGRVQIILDRSKLKKSVQNSLISTWQKWFAPNQNNLNKFGQSRIILDLYISTMHKFLCWGGQNSLDFRLKLNILQRYNCMYLWIELFNAKLTKIGHNFRKWNVWKLNLSKIVKIKSFSP